MNSITTLPSLAAARVLVRVDYNVPIKNGRIVDTRRIEASFKTLDTILKKGGIPVLLAHLGDGVESLRPIALFLSKYYNVVFVPYDIEKTNIKELLAGVPKGTVVLLENIRRYSGEEKNGKAFAKKLASMGQYYINDAFSVSHRAHASVVGVPKLLPSYAGYQLLTEMSALAPALEVKKHPFVFILGGAKFKTKIPLFTQFIDTADSIIVTGALLSTFYKVAGFEIGSSVTEAGYDAVIRPLLSNPKLLLPIDVIVLRDDKKKTVAIDDLEKKDMIVDIGPRSVELIAQKIAKAKLTIWNGPTGWYEKGFTKGTIGVATAIVQAKGSAIIGGGDTGAVVEKIIGINKRVFVSTGGGAAIDYLAKGTLPGIAALG